MVERAVTLFRSRLANCAQAVAQAWCEKTQNDCQALEHLSGYGHGRSPDGTCGALYAAKLIAGPQATQIEEAFAQASGGLTKCRDIRRGSLLPCVECVRAAVNALSQQFVCSNKH